MLYDLGRIHVSGTLDSEFLYALHHLTTLVYMISVILEGSGYEINAVLIFLGEVSNPVRQFNKRSDQDRFGHTDQ